MGVVQAYVRMLARLRRIAEGKTVQHWRPYCSKDLWEEVEHQMQRYMADSGKELYGAVEQRAPGTQKAENQVVDG